MQLWNTIAWRMRVESGFDNDRHKVKRGEESEEEGRTCFAIFTVYQKYLWKYCFALSLQNLEAAEQCKRLQESFEFLDTLYRTIFH